MCKIFITADPELYKPRARSIRLRGLATSIRLENMFWQVLDEIGKRDGLSVTQLIAKLYDELTDSGWDGANFSSFLRVCCGRYLDLEAAGHIPASLQISIASLDADRVLAREATQRRL